MQNVNQNNIYKKYLKRIFDFIFSLILIIPSSIVVFICALLIFLESKEYPFFIQKRPGYKGKIFKIYKLKSMKSQDVNNPLSDVERITKIGKIIRKLSIDELPQLWNVLVGNMSFIGPRPLLIEYLDLYSDEQNRRHEVLPGITGYAQVNGRNAISWEEKFKLDVYYVDNLSLKLDFDIIFKTIANVFLRKDINSNKNETMPIFKGGLDKQWKY